MEQMSGEERRRRSDAERNRRRLLDAAEELFLTRGLDVGVGEIAERAGVGRGTLFREMFTMINSRRRRSMIMGETLPPPLPRTSTISACLLSCG